MVKEVERILDKNTRTNDSVSVTAPIRHTRHERCCRRMQLLRLTWNNLQLETKLADTGTPAALHYLRARAWRSRQHPSVRSFSNNVTLHMLDGHASLSLLSMIQVIELQESQQLPTCSAPYQYRRVALILWLFVVRIPA